MLKPADPPDTPNGRPIGELVQELVEDGKAYARAEVDLAKAIAGAKAKALAFPAGLLVAAFLLGMAAVNALVLGVVLALATLIGPFAAGIAGLVIFAAVAAGLTWWGVERARRQL